MRNSFSTDIPVSENHLDKKSGFMQIRNLSLVSKLEKEYTPLESAK